MRNSAQLRAIMKEQGILVVPGVFDGLSARLVERAGFPAVHVSGGAVARSTGVPDLGLLSMSQIVSRLEQIVDAVDIPVIADADTGYGNFLNARHTIRAFERAGVAGLHIEDQVFPKRCGHYDNKSVVSSEDFSQKLRACRDAANDPDLVIIARTDAIAVEGFEAAIERSHAYMKAGADMIFVEAPESEEQIQLIGKRLPYPKMINMFHGGKTPPVPLNTLADLDYKIVLVPTEMQRAAIKAMQRVLEVVKRDGSSAVFADDMASFQEREEIIGTAEYLELDLRFRS